MREERKGKGQETEKEKKIEKFLASGQTSD